MMEELNAAAHAKGVKGEDLMFFVRNTGHRKIDEVEAGRAER